MQKTNLIRNKANLTRRFFVFQEELRDHDGVQRYPQQKQRHKDPHGQPEGELPKKRYFFCWLKYLESRVMTKLAKWMDVLRASIPDKKLKD